ncbi:MAG: (2Fe-2S)-binding protein [Thermoplasmata archaeon HGW-Thermoplasmata-1]|nr:MAG: (2Fe-2S)-binding protein [Thermoplasmata archaeon HGW-Thermoplasmata-1]
MSREGCGDGDRVIICRCEDVSRDEVIEAIEQGYDTIEELKRYLRIGMGTCQGRTCQRLVTQILREKTGRNIEEIGTTVTRPPANAVSLGALAAGGPTEEGGDEYATP